MSEAATNSANPTPNPANPNPTNSGPAAANASGSAGSGQAGQAPAAELKLAPQRPLILRYWVTLSLIGLSVYFAWKGQLTPSFEGLGAFLLDPDAVQKGELWRLVTCHLVEPGLLSFVIGIFVNAMFFSNIEGVSGSKACLYSVLVIAILSSTTELYVSDMAPRTALSGLFIGLFGTLIGLGLAMSPTWKDYFFSQNFVFNAMFIALFAGLDIQLSGRLVRAKWVPLIPMLVFGYSFGMSRARDWRRKLALTILCLGAIGTLGFSYWVIRPSLPTVNLQGLLLPDAVETALVQESFSEAEQQKYRAYAESLSNEKYTHDLAAAWLIAGDYRTAADVAEQLLYDNENDFTALNLSAIASLKRGNRSFARDRFNIVLSDEDVFHNGVAHFWLGSMASKVEVQLHLNSLKNLKDKDSRLSALYARLKSKHE